MSKKPLIPTNATDVELFFMKKNEQGDYEGYIGFKIKDDFNFIQLPISKDFKKVIENGKFKL